MPVAMCHRNRCTGAPVVRRPVWGKPMQMNVVNLNRSDWIRRIFNAHGTDITKHEVSTHLGNDGMKATPTLIRDIRKEMRIRHIFEAHGSIPTERVHRLLGRHDAGIEDSDIGKVRNQMLMMEEL